MCSQRRTEKMMKHKSRCHPPPYETVWEKPTTVSHSVPIRKELGPRRADSCPRLGKNRPSQHPVDICCAKRTKSIARTFAISSQEITAFFNLFDDQLIRDFLLKDPCCKMTDKYLLAMTFVYFKRARFTVADYTRKNFFIALYLANTMEEDEEEIKYEIFPWTLGKNWKKKFPSFLKQRDELWARMEYRAAVSRHCLEEVMAISPSHSLWQRERLEHHSGAQRQYGNHCLTFPRGPLASPVFCALCNHGSLPDKGSGSSFSCSIFKENLNPVFLNPFTTTKGSKKTLARATNHPSCCSAEGFSADDFCSGSTNDPSMDWFLMEE